MRVVSVVAAILAVSGLLPAGSGAGASGTAAGETRAADACRFEGDRCPGSAC